MPDTPDTPQPAQWKRLHALTPWLRGWTVIIAIIGFGLNSLRDNYQQTIEISRTTGAGRIAILIAAVIVVATIYNLIWWRMARFRIGQESVDLSAGILFRRHRSLRLDQLEAVDIVHPFVPRLFGLAELKLESAGGKDSNLSLSYLRSSQAEAVRTTLLSHRLDPTPAAATIPANKDTTRPHLFRVPPSWTIRAYLRTWEPWAELAIILIVMLIFLVRGSWSVLVVLLPLFLGLGRSLWTYLITEMGFTGYIRPDGIHLTHGLLTQVNQSIPAHRIQAIRLRQRPLWTGPDWWRIDFNVAGYGVGEDNGRTLLVPVADPVMAVMAVSAVMPQATSPELWALIDEAMHGTGPTPGFVGSPKRARIFDPLAWRRQGYARTPYALVIRTGRFIRTVTIIPHDRVLGLSVHAGPWQRRRNLATAVLHSTPGPITPTVPHLALDDMSRLVTDEEPLVTVPYH